MESACLEILCRKRLCFNRVFFGKFYYHLGVTRSDIPFLMRVILSLIMCCPCISTWFGSVTRCRLKYTPPARIIRSASTAQTSVRTYETCAIHILQPFYSNIFPVEVFTDYFVYLFCRSTWPPSRPLALWYLDAGFYAQFLYLMKASSFRLRSWWSTRRHFRCIRHLYILMRYPVLPLK